MPFRSHRNAVVVPMMSHDDPETLAAGSFHNRTRITAGTACGCYGCVSVFQGRDIKHWTDEGMTARCPKCDADAVLPGMTSIPTLTGLRTYWFNPVSAEPARSVG